MIEGVFPHARRSERSADSEYIATEAESLSMQNWSSTAWIIVFTRKLRKGMIQMQTQRKIQLEH